MARPKKKLSEQAIAAKIEEYRKADEAAQARYNETKRQCNIKRLAVRQLYEQQIAALKKEMADASHAYHKIHTQYAAIMRYYKD